MPVMTLFDPGYIRLHESGELARRIDAALDILNECTICPRKCRVNRSLGEKGACRVGALPMVASHGPHFGEERPLVGSHGSGTIFLSFCNMRCIFCQNYDISHLGAGREVQTRELSEMMLSLRRQGCHNINFVTPTHQTVQILAALPLAVEGGLDVPLVYNCGGYEEPATLRLLEGVFDIYMPDFKYGDSATALRLSGIPRYFETAKEALKEMHRQVGDLVTDERGIAGRGLLVRHLVLPAGLAGTRKVMEFIAREISPDTYVNIMDQYRPCFHASGNPPLDRRITRAEFREAVAIAREEGIHRLGGEE
jgi:putative pyruvate formate lyase activating enzyme